MSHRPSIESSPQSLTKFIHPILGLFDDAFDHEEWNGFQEHRDIFGSYLLLKAAVDLWQKEQFWTFQSS